MIKWKKENQVIKIKIKRKESIPDEAEKQRAEHRGRDRDRDAERVRRKKEKKKKPWGRFKVQMQWGWEGKKIERFTNSEIVRRELELSEVREACVSESEMRREWGRVCLGL